MNKFYIILIVSLLWMIGCSSTSIKDFSGTELDYQFALPDSGDFYFPLNTDLTSRKVAKKLDSFSNIWYSKHFFSLDEPVHTNIIITSKYTDILTCLLGVIHSLIES